MSTEIQPSETDHSTTSRGTNGDSKTSKKKDDSKNKPPLKWWQSAPLVTLIVGIVATVPPITAGIQAYITSSNQLALENRKHLHETRQKYLDRVLTERQNKRVLEFLVAVEDDSRLRDWAQKELEKTTIVIQELERSYDTRQELYNQTVKVVAALADFQGVITADTPEFRKFLDLHNEVLLLCESPRVLSLMELIRQQCRQIVSGDGKPTEALQQLSVELPLEMGQALRDEQATI